MAPSTRSRSVPFAALWAQVHSSYSLHRPLAWTSELDEDGQHFIVYEACFEVAHVVWTVRRRYNEFYSLHKELKKRVASPALAAFCGHFALPRTKLPSIPKKTFAALSNHHDIDLRRKGLEYFLKEVLAAPQWAQSFEFKWFINPPVVVPTA